VTSYFRKTRVVQKPAWSYCSSVYLPKKHCAIYRDDNLGVQMQVEVKRDWTFFPPKEKQFFFIDGVKTTFKSEEKLVSALAKSHYPHSLLRESGNVLRSVTGSRRWKASLTKG
jgi:hypothetical protein